MEQICQTEVSKAEMDETALWLAVIKNEIDHALRGDREALFWIFSVSAKHHFEFTLETVCDFAGISPVDVRSRAKSRLLNRGVELFSLLPEIEQAVQEETAYSTNSDPVIESEQLTFKF